MEPFNMKGKKVKVATIAFGKRCLNIILIFDTPRAFAAKTYSKFLALKNSALTTPTRLTLENYNRINRRSQKDGVITAEMIIRRYNDGIEFQISINLCEKRSVKPPKNPCSAPIVTPIQDDKTVKIIPNITEMRKP